jgi:hypothetical protein
MAYRDGAPTPYVKRKHISIVKRHFTYNNTTECGNYAMQSFTIGCNLEETRSLGSCSSAWEKERDTLTLKLEVLRSFEKSVTTYHETRR